MNQFLRLISHFVGKLFTGSKNQFFEFFYCLYYQNIFKSLYEHFNFLTTKNFSFSKSLLFDFSSSPSKSICDSLTAEMFWHLSSWLIYTILHSGRRCKCKISQVSHVKVTVQSVTRHTYRTHTSRMPMLFFILSH